MLWLGRKCARVRRLLSDRTDEPLPEKAERLVISHLAECHACRREAEFYQALKETAAALDRRTPPAYLWERVAMQIEEHPWGGEGRATTGRMAAFFHPLLGPLRPADLCLGCLVALLLLFFPKSDDSAVMGTTRPVTAADSAGSPVGYVSLFMSLQGDQFPAPVRDYYISQFEGIDQQIRTIKAALSRYPENRAIRAGLARVYERKIALYQKLGATEKTTKPQLAIDHSMLERGGWYD